jgi:hypothetical protein
MVFGVRMPRPQSNLRSSFSQTQSYIGAWAFSAIGNLTYGFEIDEVLSRFGSFPDYRV